ncbi:MAG: capsule polysaccharide transporter [Phycisphaerae bacterium]|nr:capsule polysaccharide transporter [Phycisphaerae bacterium]
MQISFSRKLLGTIKPFRSLIAEKWTGIVFLGWGRKRYSKIAQVIAQKVNCPFLSIEDGFIRSVGLGNDSSIYSLIVDEVGIYYDATVPSRLEQLLLAYDFNTDKTLMDTAYKAVEIIDTYFISKYNHAPEVSLDYFNEDSKKRILIIAQTYGDLSLQYGMSEGFTTNEMVEAALRENPDATLYLKVHPDVLAGKKQSDIGLEQLEARYRIINHDMNPISLLKQMDKVYTKTSQMGFEALLLGKECVCFGMPFYAGWGVTDDRVVCERRNRKLSVIEIFAAAYILYPVYYDPVTHQSTNIIGAIKSILKLKKENTQ